MRMGPAELVQAAAMARRFYLEGKSKIQIAEEFGVSRLQGGPGPGDGSRA